MWAIPAEQKHRRLLTIVDPHDVIRRNAQGGERLAGQLVVGADGVLEHRFGVRLAFRAPRFLHSHQRLWAHHAADVATVTAVERLNQIAVQLER
jgi:hypothetical protein